MDFSQSRSINDASISCPAIMKYRMMVDDVWADVWMMYATFVVLFVPMQISSIKLQQSQARLIDRQRER